MNKTNKYEDLCAEGKPAATEVPIGWQRRITHSGVVYISPSGSVLACLEQVKSYLLSNGTCKCGLECPLVMHKIFNFDPGAVVKQRTAEDAQADADVTKLCIHKRKIIAVATLHRSLEPPHPPLVLTGQGGGIGTVHMGPLSHQALRNNMHDGPPKSAEFDGKNPYKTEMSVSGQRYYNHELSSPPQKDIYSGYNRTRLGGSDHSSQQRSPYCSRHVLSPSSSTSCGAMHYGDGTPSPRTDPLGSPDPNMLGCHGARSPVSGHMNGDNFTPLSPPSILLRGSPSTAQPSCAMAGQSNVPSSPIVNAKSPIMQNPTCSFPHSDVQHRPRPVCPPQSHVTLSQLPPCVLQKKQVTSEKDPLGILDPIPSMCPGQVPLVPKVPGIQHNSQSQIPPTTVNIPPASVPLPSNLPLPTGKSGPIGHGQRVQHHHAPSSISCSPIMSPVHLPGPGLARLEESLHRSRCSSGSSEHSSFPHPTGLQVPCGSSKPFPRSPRASMGSPRPAIPPISAFKMDKLHHLNDAPSHTSGVMNTSLSRVNSMCPPAAGSDGVLQMNHSVGMPLNQILDKQNPASFPASSLLSAAAKAQLVNQSKHPDSAAVAGQEARISSSLGHPGLVGGGKGGNLDGHSTLNQRYIANPGQLVCDGQSRRAALRDKLMGMAQQREENRKRKLSDGNVGGINNDRAFDVLKHPMSSPVSGCSSSSFPEPLRRMLQQGGLPSNTSMAQLLQSMSHQSAYNGPNHMVSTSRSGKSAFLDEGLPQFSNFQQNVQGLQLQSRAEVSGFQKLNIEGQNSNMEQFIRPMNQIQDPDLAGNFGVLGYGGQHAAMGSMQGNPNTHQQQFGQYQKPSQGQGNTHFRGRPALPPMISNGSVQTLAESDQVSSSLSSELRQAQEESLQSLVRNSQTLQHQKQRQQRLVQGQPQGGAQGLGRLSGQGQLPHRFHPGAPLSDGSSSNPMTSLLQSFQVSLPERIPLPNRTMISRPAMMSMPYLSAPCHQEGHQEYQAAQGLHSRNPIQKSAMCLSSKASFNVITSTVGSSSTAASVAGEPVDLSHVLNPVIHGSLRSYPESVLEPRYHPKVGRPRKKTPERNSFSPVAMEAHTRFRMPQHGGQRRQLNGDAEVREQAGVWRNDELLQHFSLAQSRNITYPEKLKGQVNLGHQDPTPLQFPASLYAQTNGSSGGINSAGLHPRHLSLSLGSSSSAPSDRHLPKDYSNCNGHLNGHLNGNRYNGHYNGHHNGSLSSEEDRRCGDVPSSTEGLQFHHRPRTQADCPGELLWGQGKGFLSWSGKMGIQGNMYPARMMNGMQGKVESEKFQRTLTEDLETLHKANKITSNGGKQNSHLEAAIQDTKSELDKMTDSISQKERQVKTPKPKRRKISR